MFKLFNKKKKGDINEINDDLVKNHFHFFQQKFPELPFASLLKLAKNKVENEKLKEIESKYIEQNLNLTKIYCESVLFNKNNNAEILRTIRIKKDNVDLYIESLFQKQLYFKQEQQLPKSKKEISGDILITSFGDSLHEGFCEDVSNGFIDQYDLPPIDTWFYLDIKKAELHSWIPENFTETVEEIIPCSSTNIYKWKEKQKTTANNG